MIVNEASFKTVKDELEIKITELAEVVSSAGINFKSFQETILSCGLFNADANQLDLILEKNRGKFKS